MVNDGTCIASNTVLRGSGIDLVCVKGTEQWRFSDSLAHFLPVVCHAHAFKWLRRPQVWVLGCALIYNIFPLEFSMGF